jgi:paraquat-inducible protein A
VDGDVADDDEAGSVEILFKDLRVGTNEFKYEKTSDSAIRRVVLKALPVDSSLQDLVNLMK